MLNICLALRTGALFCNLKNITPPAVIGSREFKASNTSACLLWSVGKVRGTMLTFASRNSTYSKHITQDIRCPERDSNGASPNTSLNRYCYRNSFSFILETDFCTIHFNIILSYFSWSFEWPVSKRLHYRNSLSCLNLKITYSSLCKESSMDKL
jgi:hypothetical protein